ncbi:MAG: hypothetical protein KJN85_11250 [Maribacter sp.]|nr:hypothetical protein [Maribacter sp.]
MQKSSKNSIKKYTNWEEVFASAKPMEFKAFNNGRITGKVKTYADAESFPKNVDRNTVLDHDIVAFSFKHPDRADILIDCGFSSKRKLLYL